MRVSINGRLLDEREALVSAFDRGFLYGDGIFESMRAVNGSVFRLERHLRRLTRSASLIGLELARAEADLAAAVREVLRANGLENARIRVTVTRGAGRPGDYLHAEGPPTVVVAALPFAGLPREAHDDGVEVSIVRRRQVPPAVLDPAIKSTSRLSSVLARREAHERGAFEALLLDERGHLTEGTASNAFVVAGGRLLTPASTDGCLPGVTREAVIDLARGAGIDVREERLPVSLLGRAEEIFLTNTSWEVLPVTRVDGRPVGSGRPGPMAADLLRLYRELVARECGGA